MKKIGLLIPKTNLTVEYELQYLYSSGELDIDEIVFYTAKLDYQTSYKKNKVQYLKEIAQDSYKKIPDLKYLGINYIAFFCTSSAIIDDEIRSLINPIKTLILEAKKKNIQKCLLITPYNKNLGNKVKSELENNNIAVSKMINLNLLDTKEYFNFGTNHLKQFLEKKYRNKYGDIIISCTNLPTLKTIKELEEKLNINVISSNSTLFNRIIKDNIQK